MMNEKFWACPNPDACIGSTDYDPDEDNEDEISYTGDCAAGYKGNMCQSCEEGYSRSRRNEC